MLFKKWIFSLLAIIVLTGMANAQTTMGKRMIGVHTTMAQNNNYDSTIMYAKKACVKVVNMFATWNSVETSAKKYNTTNFDIANIYYPYTNIKLSLNIAPVNTDVLAVPTDLVGKHFDDTVMIHRFEHLVDTIFKHIAAVDLLCLNIGNESDVYFGTDTMQWNAYSIFYDSVKTYIKKTHTKLNVGSTLTWKGVTNTATKNMAHKLNKESDIISITYYGIKDDFTVKNPADIPADFKATIKEYPATPVYYQECGYPTSDSCKSTDSLQSQFISNVFNAWDTFSTQIPYISFFMMHDWPQAEVDTLAKYYHLNNTVFKEYLRTLGLRTFAGNGTNKPGYNMLVYQAALRNACATTVDDIEDREKVLMYAYPNPFTNLLTIKFPGNISTAGTLYVYNMMGEEVDKKYVYNNIYMLNTALYASGLYYVKIINRGRILVSKVTCIR